MQTPDSGKTAPFRVRPHAKIRHMLGAVLVLVPALAGCGTGPAARETERPLFTSASRSAGAQRVSRPKPSADHLDGGERGPARLETRL